MPHQKISTPIFRALEEIDINEIARRQPDCALELSELLDNKPRWAPLSSSKIKDILQEEQKKPNTAVFAIYSNDAFVGLGEWSSNWDTWSPYAWFIIWPEHRRKGLGVIVARQLLDKCFLENPGHEVVAAAADWNAPAIKFLKGMGFTDIGRMRRTHMLGGEYHNTLFFDILKSEYLGSQIGVKR